MTRIIPGAQATSVTQLGAVPGNDSTTKVSAAAVDVFALGGVAKPPIARSIDANSAPTDIAARKKLVLTALAAFPEMAAAAGVTHCSIGITTATANVPELRAKALRSLCAAALNQSYGVADGAVYTLKTAITTSSDQREVSRYVGGFVTGFIDKLAKNGSSVAGAGSIVEQLTQLIVGTPAVCARLTAPQLSQLATLFEAFVYASPDCDCAAIADASAAAYNASGGRLPLEGITEAIEARPDALQSLLLLTVNTGKPVENLLYGRCFADLAQRVSRTSGQDFFMDFRRNEREIATLLKAGGGGPEKSAASMRYVSSRPDYLQLLDEVIAKANGTFKYAESSKASFKAIGPTSREAALTEIEGEEPSFNRVPDQAYLALADKELSERASAAFERMTGFFFGATSSFIRRFGELRTSAYPPAEVEAARSAFLGMCARGIENGDPSIMKGLFISLTKLDVSDQEEARFQIAALQTLVNATPGEKSDRTKLSADDIQTLTEIIVLRELAGNAEPIALPTSAIESWSQLLDHTTDAWRARIDETMKYATEGRHLETDPRVSALISKAARSTD